MTAVLSVFLGLMHGRICTAQQDAGIVPVLGIEGDADAGADIDLLVEQLQGPGEFMQGAVGEAAGRLAVGVGC